MKTDLVINEGPKVITKEMWDVVRQMYAPKANDIEFQVFAAMCNSLEARPERNEIWFSKFDTKDGPRTAYLIARDLYLRKALEQPDYQGFLARPIYENDEYHPDVVMCEAGPRLQLNHQRAKLADRGKLVGAYCIVYKKSTPIPVFVELRLEDYDQGRGKWNTSKEMMIVKCAEAAGHRKAYMGIFAGTYSEDEFAMPDTQPPTPTKGAKVQPPKTEEPAAEANREPTAEPPKAQEPKAPQQTIPGTEPTRDKVEAWAKGHGVPQLSLNAMFNSMKDPTKVIAIIEKNYPGAKWGA
jgi:hypothetical protein